MRREQLQQIARDVGQRAAQWGRRAGEAGLKAGRRGVELAGTGYQKFRSLSPRVQIGSGVAAGVLLLVLLLVLMAAFGPDETPPELQVRQPAADTVVGSSFRLEGRAGDNDLLDRVEVNGEPVDVDASGEFTVELPGQDGPFTVTLTAVDRTGLKTQRTHSLRGDLTPPDVAIDAPARQPLPPDVQVSGQATDPHLKTVLLNGAPVELDAHGRFTRAFTWDDGEHTVTLLARDRFGNEQTTTRSYRVDATPPELEIVAPEPDAWFQGELELQVRAADKHLQEVRIADQVVTPAPDGTYRLKLSLPDGAHEIEVTAVDVVGHRTRASRRVLVDLVPPVITVAQPADGALVAGQFVLKGRADDTTLRRLTLNGKTLQTDKDGHFSLTLSLSDGRHRFELVAHDRVGNRAARTLTVSVDTGIPELALTTPQQDALLPPRFYVRGRAGDPHLKQVRVNGEPVELNEDGSFRHITLMTADGRQAVQVEAEDEVGHIARAQVPVLVDAVPPHLYVVQPQPGVLVPRKFRVQGSALDDRLWRLRVRGKRLDTVRDGYFSQELELPDGRHELDIVALDVVRNKTVEIIPLTVDGSAPRIRFHSPRPNSEVDNSVVEITGHIEEPHLREVVVTAGPHRQTLEPPFDTVIPRVQVEPDGTFTALVSLPVFDNEITIAALDGAGNIGHAYLRVRMQASARRGSAEGNARAKKALAEAREAFGRLEFAKAVDVLQPVRDAYCSVAMRQQVQDLYHRASRLAEVTEGLPIAPEARANANLVRLEMATGVDVVGVLVGEERGGYRFQRMDGITMIIPREKVLRMQRLSDEQRRRTLQKRYEAARRRYPTKAALHHYLRGRIAYQLQLAEPAIEELERAYATVLDLPALVANYRADNLFQTALWHDTIGATALARRACERILEEYPQTASSEAARGLLKKIQERKEQRNYRRTYKIEATAKPEPAAPPPVAEPEPVDVAAAEPEEPEEVAAVEAAVEPEPEPEPEEESTTEAVAEEPLPTGDNENRNLGATRQQTAEITSTVDLGPANKIFDAAVALYRKGISVQGAQRNELLGQAEKKFNQAIALYDQALKQDPGNADIQSRLTDANMLRYGCLKYKTLR